MPSPQIESKNLTILEDQATQEMIASKKCSEFANELTEPQSKGIAERLSNRHREHFNKLRDYLNSHQ